MKNKKLFILSLTFLAGVLAIVIYFIAFAGNVSKEGSIELYGTWLVYQYAENKIDDEYMVFTENIASDYRGGSEDPYITSSYTYDGKSIDMKDISKSFIVSIKSNNCIVLIEPDTKEWKMIRVAEPGQDVLEMTTENLKGEYIVDRVAGEVRNNEVMTFTETRLVDMREGGEFLSCAYNLVDKHLLRVDELEKDYLVYMNGKTLMLIDATDRYVWELTKK